MLSPFLDDELNHVIHGAHDGMAYGVVSDLEAEELAGFARMLAAPSGKP